MIRFPCIEIMFAGLLLVAISFYASMTFGRDFEPKQMGIIAIHLCVCLPYILFLIWISVEAHRKITSEAVYMYSACNEVSRTCLSESISNNNNTTSLPFQITQAAEDAANACFRNRTSSSSEMSAASDEGPHWFQFSGPVPPEVVGKLQDHPLARGSLELPGGSMRPRLQQRTALNGMMFIFFILW